MKVKSLLAGLIVGLFVLGGCTQAPKYINYTPHQLELKSNDVPVFNVFNGMNDISSFNRFFDWIEAKRIKHFAIDIHAPGAVFFDIMYIIQRIEKLKEKGVIVETRTQGMAMSGGFILFVSGTKGFRKCSKDAVFLIHTIQQRSMFGYAPMKGTTHAERVILEQWFRYLAKYLDLSYKTIHDWLMTGEDYMYTGKEMLKMKWADVEI